MLLSVLKTAQEPSVALICPHPKNTKKQPRVCAILRKAISIFTDVGREGKELVDKGGLRVGGGSRDL